MTTEPEILDHEAQVYKFIIEGHGNTDILEFLESSNMSLARAKAVFEDSLKKFVKAANLPKSVRLGWCFEAYRDLYRKLIETGDYSGALRAVQEIAKLAELGPHKDKAAAGDGAEPDFKSEIDQYIDTVMALQ